MPPEEQAGAKEVGLCSVCRQQVWESRGRLGAAERLARNMCLRCLRRLCHCCWALHYHLRGGAGNNQGVDSFKCLVR